MESLKTGRILPVGMFGLLQNMAAYIINALFGPPPSPEYEQKKITLVSSYHLRERKPINYAEPDDYE
jgi:hypothetical protein